MNAARNEIEHVCSAIKNLSINNVTYDDIDEQTNLVPCAVELIRVGVLLIGPTLALWQGWQCDCPPLQSRLNCLNNYPLLQLATTLLDGLP